MSVSFHAKRTAVLMAEPARDSRNINAALNANRREEMAQVMMRDSLHPDLRRRVRHAVLTFENAHYRRA